MERHKKTIFTRHLFIDLAKECGLNAAIFEQLGSGRDTEIVVDNDTLKMRARKNTSGIGNCQIPEKRYGIMSAPPGTEKIAPYNSRIGNTRILLLRIILDI